MKTVIIYKVYIEGEWDTNINEFEDNKEALDFINNNKIGDYIVKIYSVFTELQLEPIEVVKEYKFKV